MSPLPRHIAIIPDGNRRWARANRMPLAAGYRRGADRFRQVIRVAFDSGISHLTLWAASESNLTARAPDEVRTLRTLIHRELRALADSRELTHGGVRVRVIGRAAELLGDPTIGDRARALEAKTARNRKHHLTVLLGYDGRTEMREAVQALVRSRPARVDTAAIHGALWTGALPPVDLVIRTGGEPHWSAGFLMWLTAESQFIFRELLWPDFDEPAFVAALDEYANRGRRFGS